MAFTEEDAVRAPEGAVILDELTTEFIAAKVDPYSDTPWYSNTLGGWMSSLTLAQHQGGEWWKIQRSELI